MKLIKFIASFIITFSAAFIGSIVTVSNISTWYAGLEKPLLNPPNWLFGPVWTVLYALMAISLFIIWTKNIQQTNIKTFGAFAVQLVLNALWSLVFFGLHQTWPAVIVILLLIIAIVMTIIEFKKHSRVAAYLLIPYLLWVSFATYLTISIAVIN